MFKKADVKPDFVKIENELLSKWYKKGIVNKYLNKNKNSKKRFSFLDGPITANNPMGVHHGWGRTYKDLWQRYYTMKGYRCRFQNGFDCQGLWVEVEVEKELGFKNKKDIEKYGVTQFVNKCKERVLKYSSIQTKQSQRLGYFADWDNSYFTMSDENNYMIWYFLKVCWESGWLYKGHDSVPWCPRCQTAISQHEMLTEDYKEVVHKSIFFRLPVVGEKGIFFLVWTTTPWTIPANIALAVDRQLDYCLIEVDQNEKYYLAKDAVSRVFEGKQFKILKSFKGDELVSKKYLAPFDKLPAVQKVSDENKDKFHLVIATDPLILPITTTEGTGIVHTAVSAGTEDYKLGQKLSLPMIPVIADNADYLDNLGFLSGKNAKKHPEIIFDFMLSNEAQNSLNWVFNIHNYKHRYPGCWRCKSELVWKVTDEWYIAMDKGKPTLREKMIEVTKKIKWIPDFGLDRELDWLSNMHDWLISKKNRYWGLCLPIWECSKCDSFIVVGGKEELKKKALKGWKDFEGKSPHKPQLDEIKIKCNSCNKEMSRIEPVGNPWLDAGIVPFSTITEDNKGTPLYIKDKKSWQEWFPADFITESFPGQFKNWFYSMIAMSAALEGVNPFKTVLGFGTLLGEDGRPMHKSWGNSIEFNEAADKIGVDVMRWMYLRHDPSQNLLFGYKKADETRRKFHLILWNIYNFFLTYAEIDGWQPKKNNKNIIPTNSLDKWLLIKFDRLISETANEIENYKINSASEKIENFINDVSTWYIRRSRDRVGFLAKNIKDKNEFYQSLYYVLVNISKILAPFLPFISDYIYSNLTLGLSVHLDKWPAENRFNYDTKLIENMENVRMICELGHSKRKALALKVRQPLSEMIVKNAKNKLNSDLIELIKDELNVKKIKFNQGKGELSVDFDTNLTEKLRLEGIAREIVRKVQLERKALNFSITEKILIKLPEWPVDFEDYILDKTFAVKLEKNPDFSIVRI
jgi:isoleucyl-tRNA synthetase